MCGRRIYQLRRERGKVRLVLKVIITLFVLVSAAMPILFVKGSTSNVDKELEDEEQMRWLKEWRKRKGK